MGSSVQIMTCPGCGSSMLTAYYRCTQCGSEDDSPFKPAPVEWTTFPVPEQPGQKGIPAHQKCPGCGTLTPAHAVTCGDCDWAQTY